MNEEKNFVIIIQTNYEKAWQILVCREQRKTNPEIGNANSKCASWTF